MHDDRRGEVFYSDHVPEVCDGPVPQTVTALDRRIRNAAGFNQRGE